MPKLAGIETQEFQLLETNHKKKLISDIDIIKFLRNYELLHTRTII